MAVIVRFSHADRRGFGLYSSAVSSRLHRGVGSGMATFAHYFSQGLGTDSEMDFFFVFHKVNYPHIAWVCKKVVLRDLGI